MRPEEVVLLEGKIADSADHEQAETHGEQQTEIAGCRNAPFRQLAAQEEVTDQRTGRGGDRQAHEETFTCRGGHDVEARETQSPTACVDEGAGHTEAAKGLQAHFPGKDGRGYAEGNEVGQGVELDAESARRVRQAGDFAVKAVHERGYQKSQARVIEASLNGPDDGQKAEKHARHGEHVRQNVDGTPVLQPHPYLSVEAEALSASFFGRAVRALRADNILLAFLIHFVLPQ